MKRTATCPTPAPTLDALVTLALGVRRRRRVHVVYRDAAGATTTRDVEVRGLTFQGGWYASVHCRLRRAERLLRLDRILAAELTSCPARPPPMYDRDVAFYASVEYLGCAPVAQLASIRLEPPLAAVAKVIFPGTVMQRDGRSVTCHVRVRNREALAQLVRTLGPAAEWVQHERRPFPRPWS